MAHGAPVSRGKSQMERIIGYLCETAIRGINFLRFSHENTDSAFAPRIAREIYTQGPGTVSEALAEA